MIDITYYLGQYIAEHNIGELIVETIYGRNFNRLIQGYEMYEDGVKYCESEFFIRAINYFDCIDDNEDKKYTQAIAFYMKSLCYTYLYKFTMAYYSLDKLNAIETTLLTRNKEKILKLQNDSVELREKIKEAENAYLEYLKSLETNHENNTDNNNVKEPLPNWLKITVITLIATNSLFALINTTILLFLL